MERMKIKVNIDNQNNTLIFACNELVNHLNMLKIDNEKDYCVWLKINNADTSERVNDSFCYEFKESEGFIIGNNSRSVLLGVYDYLRKIGFVFLTPGKSGTFIPNISSLDNLLCEKITKTASFKHRGVCIEGANSLENVLDFIDWLPKNGYNSFFVQFKKPDIFFERWYNHKFNLTLAKENKTRDDFDQMERLVTEAMVLRDLIDHRVGHGWTAEALGYANTGWRVEEDTSSEDKKELIAEVSGKRELWGGVPTNTNLCYSNPDARKLLLKQVVDYAREHKSVNYLHFWLADEFNNVCECENCKQTTLSDQYVEILNELDEYLTKENLDTKIVFLLYQELLYAPLKSKLKNPNRFCLMFAPISRTFEKSYPQNNFEVDLKPYVRNKIKLPETVEENLTHYFNWKKIYDGDSFFYDYPLGRAHYGDFGYMKIAKVIYDDIHTLNKLKSNGYMSCQELRIMTPTGFPNFVMGQALLDTSITYEELKDTYFSAMFGDGYKQVIEYLEQLSDLSDTDYFNGHGARKQPDKKVRFLHIAQTAMAFLMDIDELHQKDSVYTKNWDFLKFHGRYCILLSFALAALCEGDNVAADTHFREFCEYINENELKVQPWLDVYRVIEVATKYTGFSQI